MNEPKRPGPPRASPTLAARPRGLVAWQTWMALALFGPGDCWRNLTSDEPLLAGRRPLHLYHGHLGGAQALLESAGACPSSTPHSTRATQRPQSSTAAAAPPNCPSPWSAGVSARPRTRSCRPSSACSSRWPSTSGRAVARPGERHLRAGGAARPGRVVGQAGPRVAGGGRRRPAVGVPDGRLSGRPAGGLPRQARHTVAARGRRHGPGRLVRPPPADGLAAAVLLPLLPLRRPAARPGAGTCRCSPACSWPSGPTPSGCWTWLRTGGCACRPTGHDLVRHPRRAGRRASGATPWTGGPAGIVGTAAVGVGRLVRMTQTAGAYRVAAAAWAPWPSSSAG